MTPLLTNTTPASTATMQSTPRTIYHSSSAWRPPASRISLHSVTSSRTTKSSKTTTAAPSAPFPSYQDTSPSAPQPGSSNTGCVPTHASLTATSRRGWSSLQPSARARTPSTCTENANAGIHWRCPAGRVTATPWGKSRLSVLRAGRWTRLGITRLWTRVREGPGLWRPADCGATALQDSGWRRAGVLPSGFVSGWWGRPCAQSADRRGVESLLAVVGEGFAAPARELEAASG